MLFFFFFFFGLLIGSQFPTAVLPGQQQIFIDDQPENKIKCNEMEYVRDIKKKMEHVPTYLLLSLVLPSHQAIPTPDERNLERLAPQAEPRNITSSYMGGYNGVGALLMPRVVARVAQHDPVVVGEGQPLAEQAHGLGLSPPAHGFFLHHCRSRHCRVLVATAVVVVVVVVVIMVIRGRHEVRRPVDLPPRLGGLGFGTHLALLILVLFQVAPAIARHRPYPGLDDFVSAGLRSQNIQLLHRRVDRGGQGKGVSSRTGRLRGMGSRYGVSGGFRKRQYWNCCC